MTIPRYDTFGRARAGSGVIQAVCPAPTATPERSLLTAILGRAILDATVKGGLNGRSAMRWLRDKGDHDWSFIWICEHIDLDSSVILRETIRARRDGRAIDIRNRPSANSGEDKKAA